MHRDSLIEYLKIRYSHLKIEFQLTPKGFWIIFPSNSSSSGTKLLPLFLDLINYCDSFDIFAEGDKSIITCGMDDVELI